MQEPSLSTLILILFTVVIFERRHQKTHPRRPRGSQSRPEKMRDKSFQVRAEEPLGTDSHRTISKTASACWLLIEHKKCFVLLCPIGEHISWVLFMCPYTTATVSITACLAHVLKKCTQSGNFQFDIKAPSDFKILSAGKIKTLFQKYKLELATGIHACIGHASCVNTREFLKDTTTADSHENVAWKSEFTFFQSLSWLFQLAYFVKCKRTLLELNFYQPYPSSWREWILSLLVYVLHKKWN